jgi:CheY-like chemotaxis protein
VESEDGKGSTFSFRIKAGLGKETIPAEKASAEMPDFSASTILVAEDVAINREIIGALLEPAKVRIEYAENGAQALSMVEAAPEKYDMIFMDVQMPEMDGYEATRRIRESEKAFTDGASHIPIIAMSANVFKEDVDKCLAAGMDGHVGKPINIPEVIKWMRKYL